ncbi:molybdopterin-dependent oxidoreductase [Rhodococcus maanshanensis]|uniref:Oxidoreductase molybdopterin binding domain-containing protein n=1 Tax=Rhodococcus maanshanensis TaxID=183556 RepID=A0A1H7SDX8_9NOCA|nr:molybdopterin-dependent oxidoreductase [Rhodococcus maanshanensis]SEL69934.1 Oxidoreductase molybdopterin binding domain-containing protein [Rhodococcus maanshanensis]
MTRTRNHICSALLLVGVALVGSACSSDDGVVVVSAAAGPVSSASVAPAAAENGVVGVRIAGAVREPVTLTTERLRSFPAQTQAVEFDSSKGRQSHVYDGAALADVLNGLGVVTDPSAKNAALRLAVLATGSDGYRAALSWGEFAPDFAATPVLVAHTEDGRPLEQPRLVVPGDSKGGRYVSGLTELRVVDLGMN